MPTSLSRRRPTSRGVVALLVALCVLGTPRGGHAQAAATPGATTAAGAGLIEGVATAAEDGAPVAFALVRLLPAGGAAPVAQVATGAGGRFRLADVPAGEYRLQLARIGYRPVLSEPIAVTAGATVRHDLRVAAQVLQLATVVARGTPACLTGDRIAEEPALALAWEQGRDGVELRRAVERQYRYVRHRRQDVVIRRRLGGPGRETRVDSVVSTPDSARARDREYERLRRTQGYRRGNSFSLPNERDVFAPEFLRDHCLEAQLLAEDGLVGVRFRPVTPRRGVEDVRGTLWLDAARYVARHLDVEWVEGDRRSGFGRLDYADVPVPGGVVRLPSGGRFTIERLSGLAGRAMASGAEATLTMTYGGFAPAP